MINKNTQLLAIILISQIAFAMDEYGGLSQHDLPSSINEQNKIIDLQNAIKKEDFRTFFASLRNVDKDWFRKQRGSLESNINNAIAFTIGVPLSAENYEYLKEQRKNDIGNFNFMLAGLELIEKNFKQQEFNEDIQSRLKLMTMMGDMQS